MNPYLKLAVAEGCGAGMIAPLLDPESDPEAILRDPPRLPPAVISRLRSRGLADEAQRIARRAAKLGLTVLTPTDPTYPQELRPLPLRPNALFARGDLAVLNTESTRLAIVGSRTHTAYGETAARDFAGAAARAGLTIVSGLAYGIDALAHEQSVDHGKPTVAVLAGALDRIYPATHETLARRIVDGGGLLLSETPPGTRASRGRFPRRNRILAGISHATLVVEAGMKSGSLHTARFATDFGLPVFAIPGPYSSPRSVGCHALIAAGAQVASSPEELLRELGVSRSMQDPDADERSLEYSADEEAILTVVRHGPRPVDLVARETGLERGRFLAAVLTLTGKARVRQLPGDLLGLAKSSISR